MPEPNTIAKTGDVIQINDGGKLHGQFCIVKEVKDWGVSLCYAIEMRPPHGLAFYRVEHGQYFLIGDAVILWDSE